MNKSFIYFICLVSAMGGLLFGYDWVVIGGAKPFYELFFGISDSPLMQGVAMTTALVGCLIGAMVAGAMADRYGRKPLLIISAVLFTVSAVATGVYDDFTLFNIARFIGGIGIGIASALSPMYIAEISPANIRGRLVSLNQMTIVLGILGAQIANWLIADEVPVDYTADEILASWNGQMGWRWMFWAEAVPASLFLLLAFFIPESPRWQTMKGMEQKAIKTLRNIGGEQYAASEIGLIKTSAIADANKEKGGLKILFTRKYAAVLTLGVIVAVFQQWCGTNVIFNYAQEIFSDAGYSVGDVLFNIVITGVANVIFTIVALFTIDRWGRRSLMLFGSISLAVIYLILGTCYHFQITGFFMVILVVAAISAYAMTLGPVTWVLLAEIFPNRVRGVAMATCTFALWTGCCTLTFSFPPMNAALGSSGSFWIYSAICFCGFAYLLRRCPETKGVSLEELEKKLVEE
ncbi:MAG: sugar porter family MFS transporter [Bacteroidaceae bacterium]|nr:sugar porter family MFS transporter [Bacteroidaceae bacterium]